MSSLTLAADATRAVIRRTWWILLVQGIATLIIGVLLLMNPAGTLVAIALFLGIYWLIGGIADIVGAFTRRDGDRHWAWSLIAGIIGVIAGLLLISRPLIGAATLPLALTILIGAAAIVSGIFNIIWAIRVRKEIEGEGWLILWGVVSVILGLWVLTSLGAATVALVWVAAILAIVGGIGMIITSFRLRSIARK